MTQVEINTFPGVENQNKDIESMRIRVIDGGYLRIDIRRIDPTKKTLKVFQDGKGNLIVEYDNKRVVDERVEDN